MNDSALDTIEQIEAFLTGTAAEELRVDVGAGYRVYYARHGRDIVIL